MKKITIFLLFISFGVVVMYTSSANNPRISVPLRFDHYYDYDMVIKALQSLNRTYPKMTQLDLVGKSEEGRSIYCLVINNPKTGKQLNKPGVYVDGNIHGNEIQAAEVALYLINYLLTNYGKNKKITNIVDKNCFYVVPMVNPDGRFHFFNDPNTHSDNRGLRIPHDDDNDGLVDEDFPDDLDGDGNICMMRKKDPFGQFKTDPEDPRLMVRIGPSEKGEWTILGNEGIDNDGDGKINEDSEGYVDANRNWGYDWMPNYVQIGAGDYPFSGKGMKALALYILKKTNICIAWTFHNYGGLYLRGPSTKAQPKYHPKDVAVYDYLGEQAERITPGYKYLVSWKDLYETYGDSGEWMSMIMGAYTFIGELYLPQTESFKSIKESKKISPESKDESPFRRDDSFTRERLKFSDYLTHGRLYKAWKPFKHPEYGDIEIGGWVKMSTRLPDPFLLYDLVHRNASAIIFSAENTPDVHMDIFETKKISRQIQRIRIRMSNSNALPTISYHAQKVRLYPLDVLQVSGNNIKVICGGKITNLYRDQVEYKEYRPEIQFFSIPGFGKEEFQFLVTGKGQITFFYGSRHASDIVKTIHLK